MTNSSDSNNSDSDGSDSDYDSMAQCNSNTNVGTEIGSGSGSAAPTSSRLDQNESQSNIEGTANLIPSKLLAFYAKGTFDPLKPLLLYASKINQNVDAQKQQRKKTSGTCRWTCNICSHTFSGSYSRVKQHLLGIGGKGVSACLKPTLVQKTELLRLQMAANAKGRFSSQNVVSQEHHNASASSKKKI